jgi:phage tail-like protein
MPRRADDPLAGFNFLLESGGVLRAGFSEITGLNSETDVIEYRTGADDMTNRKIPGMKKFGNITLKSGLAASADQDLLTWREAVLKGDIQRLDISIIIQDELKTEQLRYNLRNAWPSKWVGPDLKGGASEMAIEQLEIAHEGVTLG